MSQIKLSEIKARVQAAAEAWSQTRSVITPPLGDIPHLLELVKRLGEMTAKLACRYHERAGHGGIWEDCQFPKCRAASTLLLEIKE